MNNIRKALFFSFIFFCVFLCTYAGEVHTSDTNSDGKADAWTYIINGFVEKQEIDMNYDGEIDSMFLYEYNGEVKEEILDTNFDGKMDNWRLYTNGKLTLDKMDSDYDGNADVWVYILKNRIIRIDRDTTGDGKPDKVTEY